MSREQDETLWTDYSDSMCSGMSGHENTFNFGRSILQLNVVDDFHGQRGNAILIRSGAVADIPCTEKREFVRKWLETHNQIVSDYPNLVGSTSPILSTSQSKKRAKKSPIIGSRAKRRRRRTANKNNESDRILGNIERDVAEQDYTDSVPEQARCSREQEKENSMQYNEHASSRSSIVAGSPILSRNSYLYKRRRRKVLQHLKLEKCTKNLESSFDGKPADCNDPTLHVCRALNNIENLCQVNGKNKFNGQQIPEITSNLLNVPQTGIQRNAQLCLDQFRTSTVFCSPETSQEINVKHSPNIIKNTQAIESDSSEEVCIKKNISDLNSDSDATVSGLIEDVDSQHVLHSLQRQTNSDNKLPGSISMDIRRCASTCTKDSDETFFSKAPEISNKTSVLPSEKISTLSPSTMNITDYKSNQTDIVISSMETSPPKTQPEAMMHFNILDSGKKKRKPKKGSMVGKLRSLINQQVSSVRIWRHHMKRTTFCDSDIQSVTVLVDKCFNHLGRQFMLGLILKDSANLLSDYLGSGNFKLTTSHLSSTLKTFKGITLMTVPQLVGYIEVNSASIIRIYPPWNIIDKADSILSVTFVSIVTNHEYDNILENLQITMIKKPTVNEKFECSCIVTKNVCDLCKEQKSNKPNVMECIFNS